MKILLFNSDVGSNHWIFQRWHYYKTINNLYTVMEIFKLSIQNDSYMYQITWIAQHRFCVYTASPWQWPLWVTLGWGVTLRHFPVCLSVFTLHPPNKEWSERGWSDYLPSVTGLSVCVYIKSSQQRVTRRGVRDTLHE